MSRSELPDLSGILVIDKPPGLTSHDVVARVRRLVGMKRVGHGGTLDPFATGVLPVAIGPATRILQFVQSSAKGYLAHAVLGAETDSGDVDGTVVARSVTAAYPEHGVVRECLERFIGSIDQVPPALSAIKVGGQPLHRRVRAGEVVEVPPRTVSIYSIEIVNYAPPELSIAIACGSGTYVRSLVRDVGRALGTYAYCHGLRRTNAGPFCLGDAWSLDSLSEMDLRAEWTRVALAMDAGVTHLPAVLLGEDECIGWYHGRSQRIRGLCHHDGFDQVRVYDSTGRFAGIGRYDGADVVAPALVLPPPREAGGA